MEFTLDLDDADQVLAFTARPLRLVRDAFDDGVSFADSHLAGQPSDDHYWSHSVRYRARNLLVDADWDNNGWRFGRRLANSGIEIMGGALALRVLKAIGGGPPHPGLSHARQAYWRQRVAPPQPTQLSLALAIDGVILINGSNLIVDWDVVAKRQLVLALSKPIGVWRYQTKPKLAWRRHVVFASDDEPRFLPADEDIGVDFPDYDASELDEPDEPDELR
ncbi:MAG: hypothetical protein ABSH07_11535 [Candidatus Dormibacteria bacterium]|jgi:hypothetical protein